MEKKQKIYCNVCSCVYNDKLQEICELQEIKVAACPGCGDGTAQNESMCNSYKCKN